MSASAVILSYVSVWFKTVLVLVCQKRDRCCSQATGSERNKDQLSGHEKKIFNSKI